MRITPVFSVTTPSRNLAWASSSSPARPNLVSSNGSFDKSATPLKVFWPCVTTLEPSASISSRGNASSTHLISCRQTMSGEVSLSKVRRWSSRCRIELTFHVAIRMKWDPDWSISGKSRLFVLEQEVVTTHFPALAYHVQEGCDNRLEIRREDRRQGVRRRPSRPFLGPAGMKKL